MSEHKYLTDEQIKSMRNVAATIGIDEAGLNSVLSDLNALRTELTARDGPLSQDSPWHRWLAHTFPEIYAYISSLRAELKAAQEENGRMRKALEQYGVYLKSGHDADLNRFFLMRERALSPQPSQPDKP